MRGRLRAERGQTSVEYLGVIVVVAVIVAGLVTAAPGVSGLIGSGLRRAVCLIVRSDSCPDAAGKGTQLQAAHEPKQHGSGGPVGFVKARAGDVANAAKATGGFIGDVGVGAYDSVKGTLTLGWELSPTRAAIDPDGFSRDARAFGKATWYGITHPAVLGKALIDWNDLRGGHPGKAVGQWLPDIAIALFTGGLGTAAEGGAEAARDLSRVEKAAASARDLSRVEKAGEAARAAEREASVAEAGLPFHDAELEGRVKQTLDDIEAGVTRYPQDGTVFQNREGLLPKEGPGYYTEYTVENPAYTNRGVERLVVGATGDVYYTPDHYGTFVRIR
jgi:ribonuclease T1